MHIFYHNRPFLHKWYNQIMTMSAERQPNTEAELEQYQIENPFGDFPTFEEMQRIRQQQEHRKEEPEDIDYGNPFADDYQPRHVAKDRQKEQPVAEMFDNTSADDYQARHEAKPQPQEQPASVEDFGNPFADDYEAPQNSTEQQEVRVVNRTVVSEGKRSAIFELEMSDGTTEHKLESDYLDISERFQKSVEGLDKDPSLQQQLTGLAQAIASLDATKGDCFNSGNADERAQILEDYSKLRARLDNPNTAPQDKDLISEFFDRMRGAELDFLKEEYNEANGVDPHAEMLKADLDDLKKEVESARKELDDQYQRYDKILYDIDQVQHERRIDYGLLLDEANMLIRTTEAIEDALKDYRNSNDQYNDVLHRYKSRLGEETVSGDIAATEKTDKDIDRKKADLREKRRHAENLRDKIHYIMTNF